MAGLKNWFIPKPLMKCIECGHTALHCHRYISPALAGKIQVICHECGFQKWVDDHHERP